MCLEEINLTESKKNILQSFSTVQKTKNKKNTKNRHIAGNKVHKRKINKQLNTKWNRSD